MVSRANLLLKILALRSITKFPSNKHGKRIHRLPAAKGVVNNVVPSRFDILEALPSVWVKALQLKPVFDHAPHPYGESTLEEEVRRRLWHLVA